MRAALAIFFLLLLPAGAWGQQIYPPASQPLGSISDAVNFYQGSGCPTNALPCSTVSSSSLRFGQPIQAACFSLLSPFPYQQCIDTADSPAILREYIGAAWYPVATLDPINGYIPISGGGAGFVIGPGSSTINEPAIWANTAGTILKDGYNVAIAHTGNFSVSANLTVLGSFTATGLVTNTDLASSSTLVNGQVCALGGSCTISGAAVAIGSPVIGGTNSYILSVAAGNLSQIAPNGSGNVVLTTSPSLVTPNIGVAAGTSLTLSQSAVVGSATPNATYNLQVAGGPFIRNDGAADTLSIQAAPGAGPSGTSTNLQLYPPVGAAWFKGYISGTTLTITTLESGSSPIAIGQYIFGPGVAGTTMITGGSGSSWTVNNSQTIGSALNPALLAGDASSVGHSAFFIATPVGIAGLEEQLLIGSQGPNQPYVFSQVVENDGTCQDVDFLSGTSATPAWVLRCNGASPPYLVLANSNSIYAATASAGDQALIGLSGFNLEIGSGPSIGGIFLQNGTQVNGVLVATGAANFHSSLALAGQLISTVSTGTAPFAISSTTNVANLNASSLGGATFAAPGPIGLGTASTGNFTTMTASTYVGLPVGSTSVFGVYKIDGTTVTAPGGVLTANGGSASAITVGSTTITSGHANGIFYDAAGVFGNLTTSNNGVLVTGSGGAPSISTTLPSGLTASNITLIAPALGTPSAIVLTNGTGLPISTGLSGLGSSVAGALATNVGSAGAFVVYGGDLGTPSAGVASNLTGLPLSTGITGFGSGVASLLGGSASGSGGPAGTTSPHFVTPVLGAATGTSLNVSGSVTAGSYVGLPVGTNAAQGILECDGATTSCSGGVIMAIGGSATAVTVGTTTVGSGTTQQILFDNAGVLGEITKGASSVLVSNGSSVPSWSTTLPSGLAATNLTLTTPALGTPTAVVLTNATGCPISTCISGLGTGVATLLAGNASGTGGPAGTTSPSFTTPNIGTASGASLSVTGQLTSTVSTGTAPLAVSSTTVVANLNAALLNGQTFAIPGTIGGTTPGAAFFTNVTLTGYEAITGTTLPSQAAGKLGLGGIVAAPTLGASGEGDIFLTSAGGLNLIGEGGTYDFLLLNSAGSTVISVATGTTTLTAPGVTVTSAFTATGLVTLADLATQATNTVLGNATSGMASPTALAVGSCSAAGDALNWTTNTGFGCNTSITAAALTSGAFANPSALIGLAAVNGSATTAMRSDAAPAVANVVKAAIAATTHAFHGGI
jgi:hypothetical protein